MKNLKSGSLFNLRVKVVDKTGYLVPLFFS